MCFLWPASSTEHWYLQLCHSSLGTWKGSCTTLSQQWNPHHRGCGQHWLQPVIYYCLTSICIAWYQHQHLAALFIWPIVDQRGSNPRSGNNGPKECKCHPSIIQSYGRRPLPQGGMGIHSISWRYQHTSHRIRQRDRRGSQRWLSLAGYCESSHRNRTHKGWMYFLGWISCSKIWHSIFQD